ncbi:MAG: hypothetical protein KTR24_15125, partial [Saprospiraceae bacterium]|nr:hypothetical protein [Saprospiraceae bacterium]
MKTPTITRDRKKAIVIGYEGFVGKNVIELLTQHGAYATILAIGVKSARDRIKGVEYQRSSMANMDQLDLACDDFFMCYDSSFFNLGGAHYLSKENYKY